MKSNAKLTGFTVVAAAAFGMAAWMGCTTTSSTGNETDGGIISNPPPATTDDSGTTTDGGTDADTTSECTTNANYQGVVSGISTSCETCLQTKCCAAVKNCVDPALTDAGGVTTNENVYYCKDLDECLGSCPDETEDGGTACLQQCDDLAGTATTNGYGQIDSCLTASCQAECAQ